MKKKLSILSKSTKNTQKIVQDFLREILQKENKKNEKCSFYIFLFTARSSFIFKDLGSVLELGEKEDQK